jgi:hypothetical protein
MTEATAVRDVWECACVILDDKLQREIADIARQESGPNLTRRACDLLDDALQEGGTWREVYARLESRRPSSRSAHIAFSMFAAYMVLVAAKASARDRARAEGSRTARKR